MAALISLGKHTRSGRRSLPSLARAAFIASPSFSLPFLRTTGHRRADRATLRTGGPLFAYPAPMIVAFTHWATMITTAMPWYAAPPGKQR